MGTEDKEDGLIMIEAVYVVIIAVMVIFFAVNAGVVFHNRMIMTAIADEAASGVAEIYGSVGKEPFYGFTDSQYYAGRDVYRHFMGGEDILERVAEKKGKWYAAYLVSQTEFNSENNMDFSGVEVKCENNDIGLRCITVTIRRKYRVFILNPVSFFGLNPEYEVQATGNAVCYDVLHQMNAVAFENEIVNSIDSDFAVLSGIDTILELINKIYNAMKAK